MKIGVLALQGAFIEHIKVLQNLDVEASAVRLPLELRGLDGLIIPGGESTTMLNLMEHYCLIEPLRKMIFDGLPVLGTCAGMICLSKKVLNPDTSRMETLSVMDIVVRRNAFGRQVDSFEEDLAVPVLGDKPFHAVFIRAPQVESAGEGVDILARLPEGTIVAARQQNMLVIAFHPELTDDSRFHRYFLEMAGQGKKKKN